MKRSTSVTIIIGGIVSVIVVFVSLQLTLFAIPPQGTTQIRDPPGGVVILPDDFGELKPRQICHISEENDVITPMRTSNGSNIVCPIHCEIVGNDCVYPLSDEEIVRELQKGPQGLTQGEVAFVMKIVLASAEVQEIIGKRPFQTYCCGYESSYNQTHPNHDLLVSLNMNDKKEVVSVVVDLQTLKVTNIETDVPWGGSGEPTALPSLQQFKSGVAAEDVLCKEDLQLVIKSKDGSPACVKPSSVSKLIAQGWSDYNPQLSEEQQLVIINLATQDHSVQKLLSGKDWYVRAIQSGASFGNDCPFGSCYIILIDQVDRNETLDALVNLATKKVIDVSITPGW